MDIKVNGKELHELTKEELFEVNNKIKLAFEELKQKNLQQMDIKVNGKELHELTKKELFEANNEIKLAFEELKQKNMQRYHVGEKVRLIRGSEPAEGIIEGIGSRTIVLNVSNNKMIVSPRMIEKIN